MQRNHKLLIAAGVLDVALYIVLGFLAYHYFTCPVV
jgi:hypothetical protein